MLGDFWVAITTRGAQDFNKATDTAKAQLDKLESAGRKMNAAVTGAFVGVTAGAYAFVRAGLAGTVQGEMLTWRMQLLGRQIASIVLPAVNATVTGLSKLVELMRSLSGATQEAIFKWGGLAAGITMVYTGMGTIPGVILAAVSAAKIFGDSWGWLMEKALAFVELARPVFESLHGWFKGVAAVANGAFDAIAAASGRFIGAIERVVASVVGWAAKVGAAFSALFGPVLENASKLFGPLVNLFASVADGLSKIFSAVGTYIVTVISGIVKTVAPIAGAVSRLIVAVASNFINFWTLMIDVFQGVAEKFSFLGDVAGGMFSLMLKFAGGLVTVFTTVLDAISAAIEAIGKVIGYLRQALELVGLLKKQQVDPNAGASAKGWLANLFKPGDPKARQEVTPIAPGIEGVGAAHARIQQQIVKQFDPAASAKKAEDQRVELKDVMTAVLNAILYPRNQGATLTP